MSNHHQQQAEAHQQAAYEARWVRGDRVAADYHDRAERWHGKELQKYWYRLAAHSYRLSVEMAANPISASRREAARKWHEDNVA
jgi:hypothetical protein